MGFSFVEVFFLPLKSLRELNENCVEYNVVSTFIIRKVASGHGNDPIDTSFHWEHVFETRIGLVGSPPRS